MGDSQLITVAMSSANITMYVGDPISNLSSSLSIPRPSFDFNSIRIQANKDSFLFSTLNAGNIQIQVYERAAGVCADSAASENSKKSSGAVIIVVIIIVIIVLVILGLIGATCNKGDATPDKDKTNAEPQEELPLATGNRET